MINNKTTEKNNFNIVYSYSDSECEYRLPCGWCMALDKECRRLYKIKVNTKEDNNELC